MQREIFRKVALERLSSPEQLDQLMEVTTPRGWIALLVLAGLLTAAVIWGFVGAIPTEVAGKGVLIRGGQVYSVVSPTAGQVEDVYVHAGDIIREGQVVASLAPAGLTDRSGGGDAATRLLSHAEGRVLEVRVGKGSVVGLGATVATLEPIQGSLEVIAYLPAEEGAKVRPGMVVQVSPTNVSRTTYGFLRGEVRSVARFPATPEGMLLVLGNEELVKEFLAAGAPVEIRVALTPDATAPSGYAWSSGAGPPIELSSGTPCEATILVSTQRPIDLVLPARSA